MSKSTVLKSFCVAAVLILAGCSGIGEGTKPEKMRLLPPGTSDFETDVAKMVVYECIRSQVQLIVEFTDGSLGDFTSRAKYSSSNEAVVKVSNGDIPFPGVEGAFLPFGTIVPQAGSGAATVTASYLDGGFTASIEVVVGQASNYEFVPATVQNIAPRTVQQFSVTADLGGRKTDITSAATWTFVTPDTTLATVGVNTGAVSGLKVTSTPLNLQAEFPVCGRKFNSPLSVTPVKSLSLQHQDGFSGNLVKGTTEVLKLMAAFRVDPEHPEQDLPEQDLSTQATFTAVTPATAAAVGRVVSGVAAGTTSISATFDNDTTSEAPAGGGTDPGLMTSNSLTINVIEPALQSLAITPDNPSILSLTKQQFNAIGTYAGGHTQDITRHVVWDYDDGDNDTSTKPVTVNASSVSGLVASEKNVAQTVVIKATVAKTDTTAEISDTTNLTITEVPDP